LTIAEDCQTVICSKELLEDEDFQVEIKSLGKKENELKLRLPNPNSKRMRVYKGKAPLSQWPSKEAFAIHREIAKIKKTYK